ncbi:MAG: putative nucleotide-diphospho-sugar transferase [Ewingella sp.]
MKTPVFVSFFTDNWIYPQLADQLIADCEQFGIAHDIRERTGTGEWLANTALKAGFIHEMLMKHDHIIWIDADSRILRRPHMLLAQSEALLLRRHSTLAARRWHVGVMGIRRTDETLALCAAWAQRVREKGGTDEACFDEVIGEFNIKTGALSAKYHALPGEVDPHSVVVMGLSKDESKMAMKARLAETRS